MQAKLMLRQMLISAALVGLLGVASLAAPSYSKADEQMPATAEELEAKIRIFKSKANQYRQEAEQNRATARRYRDARDSKGRKMPENNKIAANFDAMANHDDMLARDAEKIAAFYERQLRLLQESPAPAK